jgi:Zn-dependent protease
MIIGLIVGVILHEVMHGYVAYRFGDMTAKNAGRLTLDPIAHIDPFGTLILPGILLALRFMGLNTFIIGYAKPVPINPFAFRKRWAIIWVSLAGPLTNLALGCIFFGVGRLVYSLAGLNLAASGGEIWILQGSHNMVKLFFIFCYVAYINLILFLFNLIPIPPLDGSRVVAYFLKGEARNFYRSIEPYGIIIILVFLSFFSVIFTFLTVNLANLILSALGLPKVF